MNRHRRSLILSAALALVGITSLTGRPAAAQAPSVTREVRIDVQGGYRPSRIEITAGERVRLVLLRRDYGPCSRELVIPSLDLRRTLPTGEPVAVDLPPLAPGEYEFRCGMNMIRGTLVVSPRR